MVLRKVYKPLYTESIQKDKVREMLIASANYPYSLSSYEDNIVDLSYAKVITTLSPPKKKRRLDNLTPDEKLLRKKLKNREAAQTSRDKKKAYINDLEVAVKKLKEENELLQKRIQILTSEKKELQTKNESLEKVIGQISLSDVNTNEPAAGSTSVICDSFVHSPSTNMSNFMDLDDFDWLDNITNPSNLEELEEIANSLSKEATKLEAEMSKIEGVVGSVPEIMESSNVIPSKEMEEPCTTDISDSDVIIITVPTPSSDENICIEDAVEEVETLEVIRQDALLSPVSQTDSDYLSYYSPAASQTLSDCTSLHSPCSVENGTNFIESYSDIGYESLDSPPNEKLKLLFPELM